jgi:hypothetical protein
VLLHIFRDFLSVVINKEWNTANSSEKNLKSEVGLKHRVNDCSCDIESKHYHYRNNYQIFYCLIYPFGPVNPLKIERTEI